MIYIRKIFKQDMEGGKQVAFTKEPSNVFFKFNYNAPDPDRQIIFEFKVQNAESPFNSKSGRKINTRLYAKPGIESRIDGELKQFLRDELKWELNDIIVFKYKKDDLYEFDFIPKSLNAYNSYNEILKTNNHEVIVNESNSDIHKIITEEKDIIKSNKIREFLFDVFKFLQKEFGDEFLIEKSAIAKRKLAETKYEAYLFPEYFKTHPILGSFDKAQSEESLKTSNTLRYFPENIKILYQEHIYFTTQWGFPKLDNSPNFLSFNQFTLDYSNKKYKIEYDVNTKYYELVLNQNEIIQEEIVPDDFDYKEFLANIEKSGLNFSLQITLRFIASLTAKPFLILSGLSGSGKTKIAQSFVQWICESGTQYKIVPVGADWTNREPLVGYPNGLDAEQYITPDSGVIHLLLSAVKVENVKKPFFLILDEMNLSHVERYFADFLSIMESNDTIKLYTGTERTSLDGLEIPLEIGWPKNVFIIGTVNIDETTYMFSPKVLDRANVIEFRISDKEIQTFLDNPRTPDLKILEGKGIAMAENFLEIASNNSISANDKIAKDLVSFFKQLQVVGAEFGYRSATEIMLLATKLKTLEPSTSDDDCLDIAIMQKLLPKLHGSRSKLVKVLIALSSLCVKGLTQEEFVKNFDEYYKNNFEAISIKYPISFEKLIRMYNNVLANGFTSYAEA